MLTTAHWLTRRLSSNPKFKSQHNLFVMVSRQEKELSIIVEKSFLVQSISYHTYLLLVGSIKEVANT